MEQGLIHLYCGDGKGKTTAAMGLCLRAAGQGLGVGIAQFLKPGNSGELKILEEIQNIVIYPFLKSVKFTLTMTHEDRKQAYEFYTALFNRIKESAVNLDVLLLDEAVSAVTENLLDADLLYDFLQNRPQGLEVIITGRNPPERLMDMADYISEIKMIRNPYDKGIKARKGIEL
ncbi:MAG: cob(I)yrinic acid a,c-diamide adenosyltransferase [Oscillospiraceae bacterium]|jgi:cob(I)alamin adenosyltransferase|nr:cob(I)yrinic acid a,c-diamide adenosyltransferase [Oscillospiraceae bacterium]MDD3832462.1 cob(I)yrinic acid a,c-diamide adenosyltransferase [Oscillospiraceae bacterium]MDD4546430.1 cob(I)yrinic acid a,c-diamide adenosyltransferase [Oscillospiraceae bacterium]